MHHQDFVPNLQRHIQPRIRHLLAKEQGEPSGLACNVPGISPALANCSQDSILEESSTTVFFKQNRIYKHHIARFNFTTYDVRRGQDIINPNTSHSNIMTLAPHFSDNSDAQHPFLYAKVLGIYHANVVYTGEGSVDYNSRRIEFLWVRWYRPVGAYLPWSAHRLDSIAFIPMADKEAFGFMDPSDVLRSCYIAPAFSSGRLHSDGIGLSSCAKDAQDWARYYVNRYEF